MEPVNIKDTLKIIPKKDFGVDGVIVLELEGYLDTYNSKSFQQYVHGVIEEGYKFVVIDCQGLSYVSSTGIGSFTSFNRMLLQKNGELILVRMISKVYEVFKLLGFLSFFKIFDTFDEVKNFLQNKSSDVDNVKKEKPVQEVSSVFPLTGSCVVCGKGLKFSKPGKFRCPGCKSILLIDDSGTIKKV